jgi:hypothetical protein
LKNSGNDISGKADLHLHTHYSDGKYSVEELIRLIKEKGIELFSITDHDTIDSIYELKEISKTENINYIPGIEFSTEYDGREIHILAYNINYESDAFRSHIENFRKNRVDRILKIIEKLNYLGLKFHPEEFFKYYGETKSVGRPHIADYLHKLGYVKSYHEAFHKYIGDFRVAFFKKHSPDTLSVLNLIKETGGVSFLAHPGKNFLWSKIDILIEGGLDGIEAYNPVHKSDKARKFEKFAEEKNLMITGGSDFHGLSDDEENNVGKVFIEIEKIKFINN